MDLENAPVISMADPVQELQRLNAFIGTWHGQGISRDPKTQKMIAMKSVETFKWVPGGHFIEHRWDWSMGSDKFRGLEVIGYNADQSNFFANLYDDQGHFVTYKVIEHGGIWTYTGEKQRALLEVSSDGRTIRDRWESTENQIDWIPLCDVIWTRIINS
ncbi:MAG: DUF1579 family protein [Bdellovibrionaceae bacterium]|nr:DUF1579 family protein [Pseudobdellovibrionaceae bacterium]